MNGLAVPAAGSDCACKNEERTLFGLSLCAGAGGLDLGLHIAVPGYRTVGYVERDAYAATALVARMEDAALDQAPVWDDVKTFDGKAWRGMVDIVHGGYPCQPFSVAGRKLGDKDPRHLWSHIARIVHEIKPPICFFENVGGHLRLGFEQVHDDLRAMGYRIKAGLFTAEEVGAPHRRERLFILAYCDGHGWEQGRPQQQTRERKFAPAGCCRSDAMVHAKCSKRGTKESERHVANRQIAERQKTASRAGKSGRSNLADTNGQSEYQSPNQADAIATERRAWPQLGNGRRHTHMANAACLLRQAFQRIEPDGNSSFMDASANELPTWPPSPADRDQWEHIAAQLKPAVCRVADGVAYRVDRLRLCGNGVVPLVAAYAFRTLASAAGLDE